MKTKLLLFITLCIKSSTAFAQGRDSLKIKNSQVGSSPVPIELFAGNKGFSFQLIVSKQFSPGSKFGFFNVTNFSGDYKQTYQTTNFLSQSFVTAEIWQGISAAAGLSAIGSSTTPLEVRPTGGLQYLLANREIVLVVIPRFDLSQTYNFETFAVLEYKPTLSKNWAIYTRLQGLYNYNTKLGYHEISEINLRLGLAYKKLQFGIGSIHDFYGPDAVNINNYGPFIKTDIF